MTGEFLLNGLPTVRIMENENILSRLQNGRMWLYSQLKQNSSHCSADRDASSFSCHMSTSFFTASHCDAKISSSSSECAMNRDMSVHALGVMLLNSFDSSASALSVVDDTSSSSSSNAEDLSVNKKGVEAESSMEIAQSSGDTGDVGEERAVVGDPIEITDTADPLFPADSPVTCLF